LNLEQAWFGAVTLLTSRLGFQYLYGDLSKHDPELGKEWEISMASLTLEMAEKAVRAAQAKARELGTPMTATVVDDAGRLL
jgi:Haem-degrading